MLISYQSLGHELLGSRQSRPLLCKQSQKRYVGVITAGWEPEVCSSSISRDGRSQRLSRKDAGARETAPPSKALPGITKTHILFLAPTPGLLQLPIIPTPGDPAPSSAD